MSTNNPIRHAAAKWLKTFAIAAVASSTMGLAQAAADVPEQGSLVLHEAEVTLEVDPRAGAAVVALHPWRHHHGDRPAGHRRCRARAARS